MWGMMRVVMRWPTLCRPAVRYLTIGLLIVGSSDGGAHGALRDVAAADKLTREAIEAGHNGNPSLKRQLLAQAIELDPDCPRARGEAGYIRVNDTWRTIEDAQVDAAANYKLAHYARLCQDASDNLLTHVRLARWCRQHGLADEARYHWLRILEIDPQNRTALRALRSVWFDGRLVSPEVAHQLQEKQQREQRAHRKWRRQIAIWTRSGRRGPDRAADAIASVRAVRDLSAIFPFEEFAADNSAAKSDWTERLSVAFVDALASMPVYAATESLVRHATLAPSQRVRSTASQYLSSRPPEEYVPLLMSQLATPVESFYEVTTNPNGAVSYRQEFYTEGPDANYVVAGEATARIRAATSDFTRAMPNAADRARAQVRNTTARFANQFRMAGLAANRAARTETQRRSSLNKRVVNILAQATGENIGNDPRAWWNFWRRFNEYEKSTSRPTYTRRWERQVNYVIPPPPPPTRGECFAAGTLIWTKTGLRPIETLTAGILVLAKDLETGELDFRPVMATTKRQPSQLLRILVDGYVIVTTRGHPFWVPGRGWRMAKELSPGDRLQTLKGIARIDEVTTDGVEAAYNLVVDGHSNYFAGPDGMLVHDNSPRRPERVRVGVHAMQ